MLKLDIATCSTKPRYRVGQYLYITSAPDVGAFIVEAVKWDAPWGGWWYTGTWLTGQAVACPVHESSLALA